MRCWRTSRDLAERIWAEVQRQRESAVYQERRDAYPGEALGFVRKVPALGDAALKSLSECSFTARKLRFFERFRLA